MKRILFFISFIYYEQVIAQTYVTIPDSNFSTYLQTIIPTAMHGNQMDTSSLAVKQLTRIDVSHLPNNISNLNGVQYFPALDTLDCTWSTHLIFLPVLPNRLSYLSCVSCSLTVLPALPNTLKQLICSGNYLTSLPQLPNTLLKLWCPGNLLTYLPALPNTFQELNCGSNKLTYLPALPNTLTVLLCNNNNITCFPSLPNSLWYPDLSFNPITCLPNYTTAMNSTLLAYPLCGLDNTNGCPVSADVPTAIIIPNIFTPNGDSINDTFFVKGANLTNFSCKIYDRWGALLYQWADINAGWNGKDKNGTATDGTYFYVITYTDNTGKNNTKNGFFQLLR